MQKRLKDSGKNVFKSVFWIILAYIILGGLFLIIIRFVVTPFWEGINWIG